MPNLMSWNMQGAQGYAHPQPGTLKRKRLQGSNISDALNLLSSKIDVLALQEVGGAPAGWNLAPQLINNRIINTGIITVGTRTRPKQAFVMWYDSVANGGAANNRCSMALLYRLPGQAAMPGLRVIAHQAAGLRPLIGMQGPRGTWIFTIHAPSGNHLAASGVANNLVAQIAGALGPGPAHWVCAGDYNCSPQDMVRRGFPANRVISRNKATHRNGSTLDFAIRSPMAIVGLDHHTGSLMSDHFSQAFRL